MTSLFWLRTTGKVMAKLVQVTDVEEALTYWKNGMLMCRDGERKWHDYSIWHNDGELRHMVRAALDNEMGGWILVEEDDEGASPTASEERDSTTANEVSKD